jgi:alpha-tubulin suppressor-like RCC1 family protein
VEVTGSANIVMSDRDWSSIVALGIGVDHVVGLRSDGTVVAMGENEDGQCDVSDWKLKVG